MFLFAEFSGFLELPAGAGAGGAGLEVGAGCPLAATSGVCLAHAKAAVAVAHAASGGYANVCAGKWEVHGWVNAEILRC